MGQERPDLWPSGFSDAAAAPVGLGVNPAWSDDAHLLWAWRDFVDSGSTPFAIPGHKRRAGALDPTYGRLLDADAPLYGGIDTMRLSGGLLVDAEQRAAAAWGGDWCRFSVGGSSHANQAVALALGEPGATVLVGRTAHRSTLLGLVLAGLRPVWLDGDIDDRFGIPVGLSLASLERALVQHPDAVGVLCVEPSYMGTLGDVSAVVELAHAHDVPVVVDQAWGSHLGFAPGYPGHAMAAGADAMVCSAHKTLPAFSQASFLIARTERLDVDRLERGFDATATTSPSGAILASIDAARALVGSPTGRELLLNLAGRAVTLRHTLRRAGFLMPGPDDFPGRFDPAKLVIMTALAGVSGLDIERRLQEAGIYVEMADHDTVVPIATMLDDDETFGRLTDVILSAASLGSAGGAPRPARVAGQWGGLAPQRLTPRQAFFADRETISFDAAVGRTSAEVIAPYPPGVPVLVPGEEVTGDVIHRLRNARSAGLRIAYAADPTLATVQVLPESRPGSTT